MSFELYLAFAVTALFVIALPGPTVFVVIAHALESTRQGALAIAGVLCSNVAFVTATVTGITTFLTASQSVLLFIRVVGAIYLLYLGARQLAVSFQPTRGLDIVPTPGAGMAFFQGFLTSITNPKALFFYLSLFAQFTTTADNLVWQQVVLGVTYIVLVLLVLAGYALLCHQARHFFQQPSRVRWQQHIVGSCLVTTGAFMAKTARG